MLISMVSQHPASWGIEYIPVQTSSVLYLSALFILFSKDFLKNIVVAQIRILLILGE